MRIGHASPCARSLAATMAMAALLLILPAGATAALPARAGAGPAVGLSVTSKPRQVSLAVGDSFELSSTIVNRSAQATGPLAAEFELIDPLDRGPVDPEDWTPNRTRTLDPIPSGGSLTVTWRVDAIKPGWFSGFIAVVPAGRESARPALSPVVAVTASGGSTLDSSGVVPLILGIPLLVSGGALYLRRRRPI